MHLFALVVATAGALKPITPTMGAAASVSPKAPAAAVEALRDPKEEVFRTATLARSDWPYLGHDNMPMERDKYVQETTMPGAPPSEYPLLVCCPDGLSDLSSLHVAVSGSSTCSTPRFVSQMQAAIGKHGRTSYPWRVRLEPVFPDGVGGRKAETAWLEAGPDDRAFWTVTLRSGYSTDSWRTCFGPLHLFSPMTDLPIFDCEGNYDGKPPAEK